MNLWHQIRPFLSKFVRFMHISYLEAKSNYQGTRLGLLWLPVSTLLFTGMLALVFRHSDAMTITEFFLYVLSGYILWQFIQASIITSTDIVQRQLEFAIHNNLTLAGLFGKLLMDRLFEYGINLALLVAVIVLLSPGNVDLNLALFIPFVAIIVPTSLAVSYLVNAVTIFFPDLSTLVKTGTRFMFFASPVFWVATDRTDIRTLLVQYNPVSYYMDITRQVFGILPLQPASWISSALVSLGLCVAGYITFVYSQNFVRNIK